MYEWSMRDSIRVTAAAWILLTVATVISTGNFSPGNIAAGAAFLAFLVGLLAFSVRAVIRGVAVARFESDGAGTPVYPVTCTSCGLGTEYCVQKGVIVRSIFGRDLYEGETKYRMFCPDCSADFWIGKRDYDRSMEFSEDLDLFHSGDIDDPELADRIFDYEEDVGFIVDPDPRLKRNNSIDRELSESGEQKGFQ